MKVSLFYENITVLDYAYLDDHLGVVGDSLKVHVEMVGQTDDEGILYDFSLAKNKVKEIIDRDCDHRLVAPGTAVQYDGDRCYIKYSYGLNDETLEYWAPRQAICCIPSAHVSKENIKTYLEEIILQEMPENVLSVRLEMEREHQEDHTSYFHYTHGLKDHYGNCQRLLHGHRNTIKIVINGERNSSMEEIFSREFFSHNIHFAYWENVFNKDEIIKAIGIETPEGRYENTPDVHLRYEGNQGVFEGRIPGRLIYFLQMESTVENLSIHFATKVKSELSPTDSVTVYAFEGIGKGAKSSL